MYRSLIFAHFDPNGVVDDYVIDALRCYRSYFDVVIFVSTADLDGYERLRVGRLVDVVIVRENVGYDFVSWRVGFEALPRVKHMQIVFANDSCYGPCSDIGKFFERIDAIGADFWGATINRQFRPHVQSYFMGFGERIIASGFLRRFWSGVDIVSDKMKLIMKFEVGLSEAVEQAGFRIGAVVDWPEIDAEMRLRVLHDNGPDGDPAIAAAAAQMISTEEHPNPTQLFWKESLRHGSPFVKIEILRDNPTGVNICEVCRYLAEGRWYRSDMIQRHLERTAYAGPFPPAVKSCNVPMRRLPAY